MGSDHEKQGGHQQQGASKKAVNKSKATNAIKIKKNISKEAMRTSPVTKKVLKTTNASAD